ncbi:hypothetical protein JAAARDRAFT_178964 [Jaapia argillacea MUCL 33604]|uniref:Uncharacterized protein n=1 Tax=Jaapia argillacea MUCL 33604 TaxID=933084 RepID=A0A067Q3Z9_9AGAM|nr:hypothetical protein JAAARDRAFT_178964 [Jaapia argillacea MUCL 33604]
MHLIALNLTDLLLALWRGTLDCGRTDDRESWDWAVLKDEVWREHGEDVAGTTSYLPGCLQNPPRNPAEKMTSGYKAHEFLTYVFGLGPALLRRRLPQKYWQHFCKLVFAIRILHQRKIAAEQLRQAHLRLIEFVLEYELLYYQRREDRLHFCRQSIHALTHLAPEVARLGPLVYYTQWTMERTIGNLGEEIKQPSNPYQNLSQRGLRRSQVNALKALVPELDPDTVPPIRGSLDLGGGYILLRAMDTCARQTSISEAAAILMYMGSCGEDLTQWQAPRVTRWARLRLPNGQISRSLWKEQLKTLDKIRISRNVKIFYNGHYEFGEVQFFFRAQVQGKVVVLAVLSLFSRPDENVLQSSYNTVWLCKYQGDTALVVIEVTSILSVVGMVAQKQMLEYGVEGPCAVDYFVVEQSGLEVGLLSGESEDITEE